MFCPKCGKQLEEGTRFCGFCGASIEVSEPQPTPEPQPAPEPQPEPIPEPPASQPVPEPTPEPQPAPEPQPEPIPELLTPPQKGNKLWIYIVAALSVVVVFAVVVILIFNATGKNGDASSEASAPVIEESEESSSEEMSSEEEESSAEEESSEEESSEEEDSKEEDSKEEDPEEEDPGEDEEETVPVTEEQAYEEARRLIPYLTQMELFGIASELDRGDSFQGEEVEDLYWRVKGAASFEDVQKQRDDVFTDYFYEINWPGADLDEVLTEKDGKIYYNVGIRDIAEAYYVPSILVESYDEETIIFVCHYYHFSDCWADRIELKKEDGVFRINMVSPAMDWRSFLICDTIEKHYNASQQGTYFVYNDVGVITYQIYDTVIYIDLFGADNEQVDTLNLDMETGQVCGNIFTEKWNIYDEIDQPDFDLFRCFNMEIEEQISRTEEFAGDYISENGENTLSIRQNEKGDYTIDIAFYRLAAFTCDNAYLTEDGIRFFSNERASGILYLDQGGISLKLTHTEDQYIHSGHQEHFVKQ